LSELINVLIITRNRLPTSLIGSQDIKEDVWAVGQTSELFEQAFELSERMSKLFIQKPSTNLREVKVC
jgi:hypothetical protein